MTRLPIANTFTPPRSNRRLLGIIDANTVDDVLSHKLNGLELTDGFPSSSLPVLDKPIQRFDKKNSTFTPVIVQKKEERSDNDDEKEQRAQRFRYVCLNRCSEDIDGEMANGGIQEWSIDDFECIQLLGTGGTASVFEAKEKQSGHHVALKVQKATEEAIWEVDIHESLDHSCIVQMVNYFYSDVAFGSMDDKNDKDGDVGDDNDDDDGSSEGPRRYLIMILELCEKSLFDAIRDSETGCLPEALAASYFRDILDAIEHLHDDDIIHCDCKTLNFLLANDGTQVKLADFGMSVRGAEKEVVGGSPIYMAPEHLMAWRHMTSSFDHTSDLYSLGIVLFELLVGYLPYEVIQKDGDSILFQEIDKERDFLSPVLDLRTLDDHTLDEAFYIPPPIFPGFVSEEAQDLIMRLTELVPEDRISLEAAKCHPWFQKFDIP